jgi:hypothetical protein
LPVCPAATFTDFYAQGTTFSGTPPVITDLRPPFKAKNLYASFHVCLSRFRTWQHVMLLRPLWDECGKAEEQSSLLRKLRPSTALAEERHRLLQLAAKQAAERRM